MNGAAANASDEAHGTEQQPFRTISRAVELLQPGERVVIASGGYLSTSPGRRERLDVDTWRDFYGWEKAGQVR